ncbi:MAG: methylmalonyl-CoA mutase [Chloroflexi bacterium]|nr:methylmalonyl-CoA mutase [Chloroflexota bacterium]
MAAEKIRVLLAKPPLDLHSRGILVVATTLRDAGMEVVYLEASPKVGLREIVQAAVQEDVDIIGMSILSGSPGIILTKLLKIRDEIGLKDVPIIAGGIFPEEEIEELKSIGIAGIFRPGTPTQSIVDVVRSLAGGRKQS